MFEKTAVPESGQSQSGSSIHHEERRRWMSATAGEINRCCVPDCSSRGCTLLLPLLCCHDRLAVKHTLSHPGWPSGRDTVKTHIQHMYDLEPNASVRPVKQDTLISMNWTGTARGFCKSQALPIQTTSLLRLLFSGPAKSEYLSSNGHGNSNNKHKGIQTANTCYI